MIRAVATIKLSKDNYFVYNTCITYVLLYSNSSCFIIIIVNIYSLIHMICQLFIQQAELCRETYIFKQIKSLFSQTFGPMVFTEQ